MGKGSIRQQLGSVGRLVKRQLVFYEKLRERTDKMHLGDDDAVRSAVDRAWEALYGLNLAIECRPAPETGDAHFGSMLPMEVCSECAKGIPPKQTAHVFDDRCLCLACYCKLKAAYDREQVQRLAASRAPTEQQLAFAAGLGLRVPPDVTYQKLSEMVRSYTTRPAPPETQHEAVSMGIAEAEAAELSWQALDRLLDDRRLIYRWVFSVCRHMLKAEWTYFSDCRLPHNVVLPILAELSADPELSDAIRQRAPVSTEPVSAETNGDSPPATNGDGHAPDEWFVLAAEQKEGTDAVYYATRRMIERDAWAYLPNLPRKPDPNRRRRRR